MSVFLLRDKEGERMAVRINEHSPGQGVLILLDREEQGGPFLVTAEKKYPIVSLRQPPELCGIDETAFDESKRAEWIAPYRKGFCDSLRQAVEESNVRTLVIAGGGLPWTESPYADCIAGIEVRETTADI